MLQRIADLALAHPRRLAAGVTLVFVLALAFGGQASKVLSARNDFADPGSQSAHARAQIERVTGAQPAPGVLALVNAPANSAAVAHAAVLLRSDLAVARVAAPVPGRGGRTTLLAASLSSAHDEKAAVDRLKTAFANDRAVTLGGATVAAREVNAQATKDLGLAEALAFPLLAILAFLIFRGVAAVLPLAVGGTGVLLAFAGLRVVNAALPLSVFALNLVIGLGLGLAIDYSLFMVSRFREELGAGSDVPQAVRTTMLSAGRTVLYSAVTVAVAMSSLTVFPLRFLQSMGIGGVIVALSAAVSALTILPLMFALLGARLGRVVPGPPQEGRWYAHAHRVLRRPGPVAAITAGALLLLTLPALHTHWAGVDARVLPASASARSVEEVLDREYPQVAASPGFAVVSAAPGAAGSVAAYAQQLRTVPGVASVGAPQYLGANTWQLATRTAGEAIAPASQRAIAAMRGLPSPVRAAVGGAGAEFADQRSAIADSLPAALAILIIGTLLVLWLMTDSVVLPVKALAMNMLTVGAATGLLVLVFQEGRLRGPLDFAPQTGISQGNYLVLAAIAFALSTDYGVFLLTRIKEARDDGAENDEAVALGLQRTGRIVTAAAVLLSVAIGAFASSRVVFLKEIGVGAVAAVLIDAFIVRTMLVPALMGMLGEWNWWSPAPLRRLHARIGLSEGYDAGPAPSPAAGLKASAR
jgi:RND superfamily putative drug exporter